jgi:hypothetical protein
MERRPTLLVTEILAAERQERSWESAPAPGRILAADPCRDDLRQATARGKLLHQSGDLGWRQYRA